VTNPATQTARTLLRALVDLGVRDVVLCPGSRSAPLAFAAAALERAGHVRLHVRHDERVAAFTALGMSKATWRTGTFAPAAVITTSGTATANLHPAVLEASHSNVPLLILTADRPHELRGVGANQTTNQVDLFGNAVRWHLDMPAAASITDGETKLVRNHAARAVAACSGKTSASAGPVHLNIAFRDPLTPDDAWDGQVNAPDVGLTRVQERSELGALDLTADEATIVLAGDGAGPRARDVAEAAGWPLLAEPSSGARSGANAIATYRLLLSESQLSNRIQRVVMFGHPTLSRPVQQLLARDNVEVIVVSRGGEWVDPPRRAATVVGDVRVVDTEGEPLGASNGSLDEHVRPATSEWLESWQDEDDRLGAAIQELYGNELRGPVIAEKLLDAASPDEIVWFGSSNSVRDADLATTWPTGSAPAVFAHRGLAGIDGTISAAIGTSLATDQAVRVLLGDVTFVHDVGALILGPHEQQPRAQLVVIDDDGGGIFETLEQGAPEYRADFERLFGTPHGHDLAAIARGITSNVHDVTSLADLENALSEPVPEGVSVLVIRIPRNSRRDEAQQLRDIARENARDITQ